MMYEEEGVYTMGKTNVKVIAKLGDNKDKALLIDIPKDFLDQLSINRNGDVDLLELMRLAVLAEAGDVHGDFRITPSRPNDALTHKELWDVYRIAFDASIARDIKSTH